MKIRQVKVDKIKMKNETVMNFAAAVLFGIALILLIKTFAWTAPFSQRWCHFLIIYWYLCFIYFGWYIDEFMMQVDGLGSW